MTATISLQPNREKSLLRKHPWVFASAIKQINGKVRSGETVDILDSNGKFIAKAAWSPKSQIQARVWSFDQQDIIDNGFFVRKIEQALALRKELIQRHGLTGYRVVAAEADGLPGITIDKYNDVLVCQLLSAGAEKHRSKIVWALTKCFPDCSIYERSDVAVRAKEGLEQVKQTLHGDVPDEVVIEENGVKIIVDIKQGHKTGFYLDQRDNRQMAATFANNKDVLNCFSYTGTFASYALKFGANKITNLDVSDSALALAERNLTVNNLDTTKAEFINKDVFTALREYKAEGIKFDMIILDPPKFVDSKASLNRACRGYKDINMLAMQILNPGGLLFTFSCSGLLTSDLFQKVVADAALDANKDVHYLYKLGQAADHPIASQYPEGFYLKGLVCRVA